jgi:hypothetical protein
MRVLTDGAWTLSAGISGIVRTVHLGGLGSDNYTGE